MPTVSEIINKIAPISQYMAANGIERSGWYNGNVDVELPRKIYLIRKSCEYVLGLDPSNSSLSAVANYLLAICGSYAIYAQYVTGIGSGSVSSVGQTGTSLVSPLPISSSDFDDSTHWNGRNSLNQTILSTDKIQVFWDDAQVFMEEGTQWERTSLGINIIEPGFDAVANNYRLYIFISRV